MAGSLDTDDDMRRMALRKGEATANGGLAFQRLRRLAKTPDFGQVQRVARAIAATCNPGADPFDLCGRRAGAEAVSDDRLLCTDARRWSQSDLPNPVPDGDPRLRAVVDQWGLNWPQAQ